VPAQQRALREVGVPLAAMLSTQTLAAMTLAAVPVLAPEIARDAGVAASTVGAYTSLLFAAAMFSSAMSGTLIARLGAVGANQAALLGSGLALLVTLPASVPAVALGAVMVGAGYGPNTPSGSHVLSRVTPAHMRAMVFSIKQSGASLGAMLAGVALPWVAVTAGWKAAIVVTTLAVVLAAAALHPLRRRLDRAGHTTRPPLQPSALAAMRTVLATPALRRLTAAAFVLMVLHGCFQTFTVSFLVEHVELSLTAAGGLFSVLAASGSVTRIALGWLADRLRRPREVLIATSVAGAASCLLFAAFGRDWSVAAMTASCVLAGAASAGWYGLFLAEVARQAPAERVGLATGGALFFVYAAIVVGPLLFAGVVAAGGGYVVALYALGATTLVATWNLLRLGREAQRETC
jgi:MFS family permease